jgi:hypothetical protein
LILGIVLVFLLVTACALTVLLSVNTGVATYNREKINFIANQAATYAATYSPFLSNTSIRKKNVTDMVNGLMTGMGLNGSNTTVTITDTTVGGKPAVSVSVSTNLPTVLAANFSSILPQQLQSDCTAVAVIDPLATNCLEVPYATGYAVGVDPFGGKVLGNLVSPTGALPNDGQPAWLIGLTGLSKLR